MKIFDPDSRRMPVLIGVFVGLSAIFQFVIRRKPPVPASEPPVAKVVTEPDAGLVEIAPVPAGDLRKAGMFDAAIYHPKKPAASAKTRVATWKPWARVEKLPQNPVAPTLMMLEPTIAELPPPHVIPSSIRGLTTEQQESLAHAVAVTAIAFVAPPTLAESAYRDALRALGEEAKTTGGILWDESTRQAFSNEAWAERLDGWDSTAPPLVDKHITIHMYRNGSLIRLVTLGMAKLGLPDVEVNEVSAHEAPVMGTLVSLLCQTLAEKKKLDVAGTIEVSIDQLASAPARASIEKSLVAGAARKATLSLSMGHVLEGDADNRLIEIVFPGPKAGLQARQASLLTKLFGAQEELVRVDDHDPELAAASARAKLALAKLQTRWAKGRPELETLMVKAPFATPAGSKEWMWVEVLDWKGTKMTGILQNDAFEIPSLKIGARVDVDQTSVFDYFVRKGDQTIEGGETIDLMTKKQKH